MIATMDLLAELEARGLVQDSTDRTVLRTRLGTGPLGVYVGFDPTADSLHVGHLMGQLGLRRFQRWTAVVTHHAADLLLAGRHRLEVKLDAGKAVHRGALGHNRRHRIPAVVVHEIAQNRGRQIGAGLVLGRAWECLGILLEPFDRADNSIDLLTDLVVGDDRLAPVIEGFDLLVRPLRAVAIAPRDLLLLDLQPLAVEVGGVRQHTFFQRPKTLVVLAGARIVGARRTAARTRRAAAVAGEVNDVGHRHVSKPCCRFAWAA